LLCGFVLSEESKLADCPFHFREAKNGSVQIGYKNRVVTTLRGKEAAKFMHKVQSCDEPAQQVLMAKATGHFKHGNERVSKNRTMRKLPNI